MTIRREDLVAAAAVGLLQYRQIEPLLVFLLLQDVRAQRQALLIQTRQENRGENDFPLSHLPMLLATVAAALFAILFTTRAVQSAGISALLFFTALYAAGALALAEWFKRCGYGGHIRTLSALAVASVPLAVFTLQQITV